MRALIRRELLVAGRRPAIVTGSLTVAVPLTLFVLVWPQGMRVGGTGNVYEQARLLAFALLAAVLPWTAARGRSSERGDALVRLTALTGWPPATFVVSTALAHATALALVATAALPPLMLARQQSAVVWTALLNDLATGAGVVAVVAAATIVCVLLVPGRLASWVVATLACTLCLALSFTPGWRWAPLAMVATAIVVVAAAARWAEASLSYLGAHRV